MRKSLTVTLAVPLLALACIASLVGCGARSSSRPEPTVEAAATSPLVADLLAVVGGRRVASTRVTLGDLAVPADQGENGTAPTATTSDRGAAALDAEVVFRSGGAVDRALAERLRDARNDPATLIDLSKSVAQRDRAGLTDPYWWHDPRNVEAAVNKIRDVLVNIDKAGAEPYRRHARSYLERVRSLDTEIERCIATLPAESRTVATDHRELGYFAERYGLRFAPVVIPSTATSPRLETLIAELRKLRTRAVLARRMPSPQVIAELDREHVRVVSGVAATGLGAARSATGTYLGAQASNARVIVGALSSDAPACAPS